VEAEGDATLKQFEVLWGEIARRSNAQQTLIGVTATATGTVVGLVVSKKADALLLAALAIVAPVFGLLWVDHAQNIGKIATFIRRNWAWRPNWEHECYGELNYSATALFRYGMFITAVTLIFLGPAVAGLTASYGHVGHAAGRIVAWAGAVTVTALFTTSWCAQIVRSFPQG